MNDLHLYGNMLGYNSVDHDVAASAITALKRHMWYLTEELIPLSLCSRQIPSSVLEKFAFCLHKTFLANRKSILCPQKPIFPSIVSQQTDICDLVGNRSVLLFQRMKFTIEEMNFLRFASHRWQEFQGFERFQKVVGGLKVVNDAAERGVRLMEEYKDILTTDPEQRKMILHGVEYFRKSVPDFKKSTLAKK